LGGLRSNLFHLREITLRSLIFRKWVSEINVDGYTSRVAKPLMLDSKSKSKGFPSFYALVIYWGKEINVERII